LSNKVWHTPLIRSELARLAQNEELNSKVLVRAVDTRWNTYTDVLERGIDLQDILTELCDQAQFNKGSGRSRGSGMRLRELILVDEEWTLLEQLHRLLAPFAFATKQMSSSAHARVHEVLPYFDILTAHLDDFADDTTLHPAVCAAAQHGRIILNLYYSHTDESII
ncbi:hypothetical protein L227DRAFT_468948, partial [Lentinus tigrinus ALCF2SS1-6]